MVENLAAENRKLKLDERQQLEGMMRGVHDAISQLQAETERRNRLEQDKPQAIPQLISGDTAGPTPSWEDLDELSNGISILANEVKLSASDQVLLSSLRFEYIAKRQATVESAHEQTFKWVLDPSSPGKFDNWIRSQNGIYWIMGKAGSGKSTLMKFLLNHTKTAESLNLWAGPKELVTASFFFWNAGPSIQKSQEGLFRSLLYEILSQCPDLTRTVCSLKAETFRPFVRELEPWTRQELWQAIARLKESSGVRARFCFFIDGLDEYDGEPDHIISVLESLRSWPDVKLCISSRPWNEFKDAFGRPSDPQLALEDLTREDIRLYVRSTLEEDSRFEVLKAKDDRSQDLVQEIVDKAQGVFLWVILVVRSLLTGLRNADRICDLQKRLREFPATLEKFFGHMIASIEPIYREQTAQAFKIALEAEDPLSLMTYSFFDEEDLDAVVTAPLNPLATQEIISRQDDMRRRLNGRCKGLLEVISDDALDKTEPRYVDWFWAQKVGFHHRTARDFLQTNDMQNMLLENLEPDFEPKLRICKALLAQLKAIDYREIEDTRVLPMEPFKDLVYYARRLEYENHAPQSRLLDEAGQCVSKQVDRSGWSERDFLNFVVQQGFHRYITETLKTRMTLTQSDKSFLLGSLLQDTSIFERLRILSTMYRYLSIKDHVKMVDILLKYGAQPNDKYEDSTVWGQFVLSISKFESRSSDDDLLPAIESLLSHGAKLQQRIVTGQMTQGRTRQMSGRAADLHKRGEVKVDIVQSAQEIIIRMFGEEKIAEMLRKVREDRKSNPSRLRWWSGRSLRAVMKNVMRCTLSR